MGGLLAFTIRAATSSNEPLKGSTMFLSLGIDQFLVGQAATNHVYGGVAHKSQRA
jgi:hypothetical protein